MADKDTKPTDDTNQDTDNGTDSGTDSASDPQDELKLDTTGLTEEQAKLVEEKVKGFQSDYTKKTQTLAEEKKKLKDKIDKGDFWENWHQENKGGIEEYNKWLAEKEEKGDTGDDLSNAADDVLGDDGVKKAIAATAKTKKELESQMTQGFNMLVDLVDVQNQDEFSDIKIDAKKVVKYAFDNSITDMGKAVKLFYQDDIQEATFKKRLEAEKVKWDEQNKTNVLSVNMPMGRTARQVIARNRKAT